MYCFEQLPAEINCMIDDCVIEIYEEHRKHLKPILWVIDSIDDADIRLVNKVTDIDYSRMHIFGTLMRNDGDLVSTIMELSPEMEHSTGFHCYMASLGLKIFTDQPI